MRITIEYESSWRNSFLSGDNNSPLPPKGRAFVGSMTELKKNSDNFIHRDITLNTVMGLLNRLIGDQRKLYQSREKKYSVTYYFEDLEERITFNDQPTLSKEIVFVRNMKGSKDQNSFSGILKTSDPLLSSDYSGELWGIMELDFTQLCDFIIGESTSVICEQLEPLHICDLFEKRAKEKPVQNEGAVKQALIELEKQFPSENYLSAKGLVVPSTVYCSALYIQLERLQDRYDLSTAKTKSGGISGVSKRTFTKKDFMKRFTTGNGKIIYGNPYIKKERIKGEGEVTSMLTKASGQLEITIDVDKEKGREIAQLIENAGVSTFYLGKKGLAYVSKIRL